MLKLLGNRFLTFATVVRVRQIEMGRDEHEGPDESSIHTPAEARAFREAIEKGWPGARITWAFSWLALNDQRQTYLELKELIVSYHKDFGDKIIDFTRYDLPAQEPADPGGASNRTRNWSLMNRLNQKQTRPQDRPILFGDLSGEEQEIIRKRYAQLG